MLGTRRTWTRRTAELWMPAPSRCRQGSGGVKARRPGRSGACHAPSLRSRHRHPKQHLFRPNLRAPSRSLHPSPILRKLSLLQILSRAHPVHRPDAADAQLRLASSHLLQHKRRQRHRRQQRHRQLSFPLRSSAPRSVAFLRAAIASIARNAGSSARLKWQHGTARGPGRVLNDAVPSP